MKKRLFLKIVAFLLPCLSYSIDSFAVVLSSANYVYRGELYTTPQASVQIKMTAIAVINDFDWIQEEVYGTTDANGYCYLSIYIPDTEFTYLDRIFVEVVDANYNTVASANTSSNSSYHINPAFAVIVDQDFDGIEDAIEVQLAEKFKPVLHKHSHDKQQGLSNVDWVLTGKSTLKAYNALGQEVYNAAISTPADIHVYMGSGDRDSFGTGDYWTEWQLDIDDSYRYNSAPIGQRPIYYHVYKEGNHYFVQYWFFFNMNDIIDQTVNDTWHEGDFEHVSLKIDGNHDPVAINFFRHEGGRTISPNDCWWSSSNALTYSGISQGYSSNKTNLHIWIAANSHASYNRYDLVYSNSFTAAIGNFCMSLDPDSFIDNVDYDPAGYDLYFEYDYLEKLGEYKQQLFAHDWNWAQHYEPVGPSKLWLNFIGRFGEFWAGTCNFFDDQTASPLSPIFPNHEWLSFTEDYSQYGFGNHLKSNFFLNHAIFFTIDPSIGD